MRPLPDLIWLRLDPKGEDLQGAINFFINISSCKIKRLFKAKNEAEIIPEQVQSNFQKFHMSHFSAMKTVKMTLIELILFRF